jgi:hypothetical protein
MKPPRTTGLFVSPWIAVAALIAGTVDAGTVVEYRAYLLRERRQYDAAPPRRRLLVRKAREVADRSTIVPELRSSPLFSRHVNLVAPHTA